MKSKVGIIVSVIVTLSILIYGIVIFVKHKELNKTMTKNKNNETNSRTTGFFVGFDTTLFKPRSKVLNYRNNVMLIATDGVPYYLSLSPEIDPTKIKKLKDHIASLQFVDFETNSDLSKRFYELPEWLSNERHLNYLKLNSFKINDFALIKLLPLKHLMLNNLMIANKSRALNDICEMKALNYLVFNDTFNDSDVVFLKAKCPKLNILSLEDYSKLIEAKELKLW